ncbi:DUF2628 domain-containing protein [Mycobacterium sp. 1274756.6]|uniref:DUF2628 domain-containing protein n=1 Tax=Mycobacterium sp. 1274756.6 TaxID=1834076 RepID=UPI0007FE1389|nr:DUF2628 domain-containing protein [Mycobacterium sp. 1274756.6]OBJ69657.1 hypothetical protein A5643_12030 [Mycobacterium sp. 1274756.6]
MNTSYEVPEAWRSRFEFFDRYGHQASTPEARAAYKALPFGGRLRISANILAFLFGPIYFFVKGMWRKGLSLLLAAIVVSLALSQVEVSDGLNTGIGTAFAAVAMLTANYAYYLHVTKASTSWNPFEGTGKQR